METFFLDSRKMVFFFFFYVNHDNAYTSNMNYLKKEDSFAFEKKTVENFKAATLLVGEELYNAASTRIYYCLIHLALRNAAKYEVSKDIYTMRDYKGTRIDKSSIEKNAVGFHVKDHRVYQLAISRAKSTRIKADYYKETVIVEEIDDLLPDLKQIMATEGIRA